MTSVGPGVVVLLLLAVAVGAVMVLGAVGRVPMSMEPPRGPWWVLRRRRREARKCEEADVEAISEDGDADRSEDGDRHAPDMDGGTSDEPDESGVGGGDRAAAGDATVRDEPVV